MSAPTLRDVADAAGVHPATVSRALNPGSRSLVNDATAKRVLRAAERLGYRPNPIARSLKTARSGSVGVVIPDLTNPLFPPIVRGIQDVLGAAGYTALIVNTDDDSEREESLVESLRSRQVEGLIIGTALLEHPLLDRLHDQGVPMVMINRRPIGLDVPSVAPDDAGGIELAVDHLVGLGHRRIAHLAGPATTSTGRLRAKAFRSAVQDRGIDDAAELVVTCDRWTEEAGARAFATLLDTVPGVSAVVAGNDLIALGCYDVMRERGLSCPGDLSVVGFNDTRFIDKFQPPLTSVSISEHEIGCEAARMLLDGLRGNARPARSVLLPVNLVVRGSTGPPAGERLG